MFCPNCGQQQIADTTKFCPRCGTQLAGLAEWLAGGAPLVAREAPAAPPAPLSPRRRAMRRGAKVMFLSGVMLPFVIAMSAATENPGPFVFALIIFFIGFSMRLYARIFGEDAPRVKGAAAQTQLPRAATNALPPAADNRVNHFARRGVRTAELSQPPPSVTDHTTRLLDDE